MHRLLRAFCLLAVVVAAPALAATPDEQSKVALNAKELRWVIGPPSLPQGARIAVLYGDPASAAPYVMRIKTPAGFKWRSHWHSTGQAVTVLSGAVYVGYGDRWDDRTTEVLRPGGFHFLPAHTHRYLYTKSATIFEVQGQGPFDVNYVNPEDDPAKWAPGKKYYFPSQFELHAQPPGDLPATF